MRDLVVLRLNESDAVNSAPAVDLLCEVEDLHLTVGPGPHYEHAKERELVRQAERSDNVHQLRIG